jgi:hypothetical protein
VDEVRIPPAGDDFYAAGISRRTHEECVEAMHQEEERLGRKLTDGEREAFAHGFHAPEYREDLLMLSSLGLLAVHDGEEDAE